jgi:Ca2+-binding RTX toxin-like protein
VRAKVRGTRKRLFFATVSAALLLLLSQQVASAATWVDGDVFAGATGGTSRYDVYSNDGVLKDSVPVPAGIPTGCSVSDSGDLLATNFTTDALRFDGADPHSLVQTISSPDAGNISSESLVHNQAGDFLVGHADGSRDVDRFNSAGVFQQTYDVPTGPRGTDWIELAADQKTLFYTSEGTNIHRYDLSTNTALSDYATNVVPGGTVFLFALRLLPPGDGSGGLIVGTVDLLGMGNGDLKRVDAGGNVIQTYDAPGEDGFFAMNLDPNGTSLWSAGIFSGNIFRWNIATGALELGPIDTAPAGPNQVGGLCLKGEVTAARPKPESEPTGDRTCRGEASTLVGTAGSDDLEGTEGDDVIVGGRGKDTIQALAGNDLVCGRGGQDSVQGDDGNDGIFGNAGRDVLEGNAGDDKLGGGSNADKLFGGGGNDKLVGGTGPSPGDDCTGGSGKDTFSKGCQRKND